jgi:hypothetical protein
MSSTILRFRFLSNQFSAALLCVVCSVAFAQTRATPAVPPASTKIDIPDGAPEFVVEKTIGNTSVAVSTKAPSSVIVEEERVLGRLANAHVRVGASMGYIVVDPNAGRTDRQADNAGKRVSPSMWELFRF